jgi:hypothetical protein
MSNQVYTDIEHEYLQIKRDSISLDAIIALVNQYPDNAELGSKIREFINLNKKNHDYRFKSTN